MTRHNARAIFINGKNRQYAFFPEEAQRFAGQFSLPMIFLGLFFYRSFNLKAQPLRVLIVTNGQYFSTRG